MEQPELFRREATQRFSIEPSQPPLLSKPISSLALGVFAVAAACALVMFATSFQFARKEQARGYLMPASGWSRVSTQTHGIVHRRLVESGDKVQTGDVLLELSPGDGLNQSQTVERKLLEEIDRTRELLEKQLRLIEVQRENDRSLHAREQQENESQFALLEAETAFHKSRLTNARQRHDDGRRLFKVGSLAEADVVALADEVDARALNMSEKEREAGQRRFVLETGAQRLQELELDAERQAITISEQIHDLAMEESRIRVQGETRVLAPRDGVVASVRVMSGDRLQPGAPLLDIVPDGDPMRAHLFARSSAMGFVEVGQQVRVYLDAFPYERYGAQLGTVARISETTLQPDEVGIFGSGAHVWKEESTFQIEVDFPQGFRLPSAQLTTLRPGMTLSADLVRDQGTLVDWIVEPLRSLTYRL